MKPAKYRSDFESPGNLSEKEPLPGQGGYDVPETGFRKLVEDNQAFFLGCRWLKPGGDFFTELAEYLAKTLDMDFVCINRILEGGLEAQTFAVYCDGHHEDNFKYWLQDTPYKSLDGKAVCFYRKGVRHLYPRDRILQKMMAESYAGTILHGSDGRPVGLIEVIGRKPVQDTTEIEFVLKQASIKATGEIEYRGLEETLREIEFLANESRFSDSTGSYEIDFDKKRWKSSGILDRILGIGEKYDKSIRGWLRIIHPEDRAMMKLYLADEVLPKRGMVDKEYRIIRPADGEIRWVRNIGKVESDGAGNILSLKGIIHNITDRKLAEEETRKMLGMIRQERDKMTTLLNSMVDEVWFTDDRKQFTLANNLARFELHPKPGTTVDLENLATSLEVFRPDGSLRPLDQTPSLRALNGEIVKNEEEIIRIPQNGELRTREVSAAPVKNSDGDIIGSVAVVRDITDRKLTEEALLESRATLVGILNASPEPIRLFNTEGVLIMCNQAALAYYGMESERIIGRSVFEFLSRNKAKSQLERIREVAYTGHQVKIDEEESGIMFEQSYYPVANANMNIDRVAIFSQNITLQKQAEDIIGRSYDDLEASINLRTLELRKINKLLTGEITERKRAQKILMDSQKQLRALAQRIHEIAEEERTSIALEIHDELGHLITVLKYEMESLTSTPDISVKKMKCELQSLVSIVDSLLDSVRRISTELRPGILDHLGLIPALEWQVKQFARRTKISCHLENDDPDRLFSKNETTNIFRIVQEILTNIARHANADHVDVIFTERKGVFLIKITDNGKGFVQKKSYFPRSLGLVGMQERALSIGGELLIDSEPGKGTTITFTLGKN